MGQSSSVLLNWEGSSQLVFAKFVIEAFTNVHFLNQVRAHTASCGRTPGLLKLSPEKCVSVPIYLSLSIHTGPHEQTILVVKAALMHEI